MIGSQTGVSEATRVYRNEKPVPSLWLEGFQKKNDTPSDHKPALTGGRWCYRGGWPRLGPCKEELEPLKRVSCCQKRESRERENEKYPTFSPPLTLQPCTSACYCLNLPRSQKAMDSGNCGSLQCVAKRKTSQEWIQEKIGSRPAQAFIYKDN